MQPIIDRFKNTFFDGNDQDPEIGAKPKRGRQKVVKETFESENASPKSKPKNKKTKRAEVIEEEESERSDSRPRNKRQKLDPAEVSRKSSTDKSRKGGEVVSKKANGGSSSRVTAPEGDIETKVKEAFKADNLKSLKVPELREFLTSKDLAPAGNKTLLISMIKEYFEN